MPGACRWPGCLSLGAEPPPSAADADAGAARAPAGASTTGPRNAALAVLEPERQPAAQRHPRAGADRATPASPTSRTRCGSKSPRGCSRASSPRRSAPRATGWSCAKATSATVRSRRCRASCSTWATTSPPAASWCATTRVLQRPDGQVQTRRFESRVPGVAADAAAVGPALNQAANQVASEVAEWVG